MPMVAGQKAFPVKVVTDGRDVVVTSLKTGNHKALEMAAVEYHRGEFPVLVVMLRDLLRTYGGSLEDSPQFRFGHLPKDEMTRLVKRAW